MADDPRQRLACGCEVQTSRDFLGRVIGTIVARGGECPRSEHAPGHAIVMPGRDNARPQDR